MDAAYCGGSVVKTDGEAERSDVGCGDDGLARLPQYVYSSTTCVVQWVGWTLVVLRDKVYVPLWIGPLVSTPWDVYASSADIVDTTTHTRHGV